MDHRVVGDAGVPLGVKIDHFVDSLVLGAYSVHHVVAQLQVLFAQPGNAGLRHFLVERLVFQVNLFVVLFGLVGPLQRSRVAF